MLTVERSRELLDYDPETGVFRWKCRRKRIEKGSTAGSIWKDGYCRVQIDRRSYAAHRLAWLHVYGYWPADQIDHINGVRDDNRFCNLRAATPRENVRNSKVHGDNKSGLKGVRRATSSRKWEAAIRINSTYVYLGRFDTAEDAHAAYCVAAIELHGKFARFE
jgi:hypothetical protein